MTIRPIYIYCAKCGVEINLVDECYCVKCKAKMILEKIKKEKQRGDKH